MSIRNLKWQTLAINKLREKNPFADFLNLPDFQHLIVSTNMSKAGKMKNNVASR